MIDLVELVGAALLFLAVIGLVCFADDVEGSL